MPIPPPFRLGVPEDTDAETADLRNRIRHGFWGTEADRAGFFLHPSEAVAADVAYRARVGPGGTCGDLPPLMQAAANERMGREPGIWTPFSAALHYWGAEGPEGRRMTGRLERWLRAQTDPDAIRPIVHGFQSRHVWLVVARATRSWSPALVRELAASGLQDVRLAMARNTWLTGESAEVLAAHIMAVVRAAGGAHAREHVNGAPTTVALPNAVDLARCLRARGVVLSGLSPATAARAILRGLPQRCAVRHLASHLALAAVQLRALGGPQRPHSWTAFSGLLALYPNAVAELLGQPGCPVSVARSALGTFPTSRVVRYAVARVPHFLAAPDVRVALLAGGADGGLVRHLAGVVSVGEMGQYIDRCVDTAPDSASIAIATRALSGHTVELTPDRVRTLLSGSPAARSRTVRALGRVTIVSPAGD
jgi:hypothetical protein